MVLDARILASAISQMHESTFTSPLGKMSDSSMLRARYIISSLGTMKRSAVRKASIVTLPRS